MSNCPKIANPEQVIAALKSADCDRVTWNYQIYASQGEIKAEKRISIWTRHDSEEYPLWKRQVLLKCDMDWVACQNDGDEIKPLTLSAADRDKFQVHDDAICFNGGFLKVYDPGLAIPLASLQQVLGLGKIIESRYQSDCDPFEYKPKSLVEILLASLHAVNLSPDHINNLAELSPISSGTIAANNLEDSAAFEPLPVKHIAPFGRNIHIEVEFDDDAATEKQPLFFFPQDDNETGASGGDGLGTVFLALDRHAVPEAEHARQLIWVLSQDQRRSDPFDLGSGFEKHMVSVSQDSDWRVNATKNRTSDEKEPAPYFEMLVDSVGIGDDKRRGTIGVLSQIRVDPTDDAEFLNDLKGNHQFGTGERTFYVGFAPGDPHRYLRGWRGSTFHGNLHRLVFDPNTNCDNC